MTEDITEPKPQSRRHTAARLWVVIVTLAVTFHLTATTLWVLPSSPVREVFPGNSLSTYMNSMFSQAWTVFAPQPANTDFTLHIRAATSSGTTDWIDATDVEMSHLDRNIFVSRAYVTAAVWAAYYTSALSQLTSEQQAQVKWNYLLEEAETNRSKDLIATGGAGTEATTETYLEIEDALTAYSTQVALATWGEDVRSVQFVVRTQGIVPFANRLDRDAQRPDVVDQVVGWRRTLVRDGQDPDAFRDIFPEAAEVSP